MPISGQRNNFRFCNFLSFPKNFSPFLLTFCPLSYKTLFFFCSKFGTLNLYKTVIVLVVQTVPRIHPQNLHTAVTKILGTYTCYNSLSLCFFSLLLTLCFFIIRYSCHTFALHHFHIITFQTITIAIVISSFSLLH